MKLMIFGATGGTGRQIVAQALAQGHQVTAFVRQFDAISIQHANLKIVIGNVLDLSTVEIALPGHDAVLCSLGMSNILDKSNLRAIGTKNIIRALKKNNITRFICQSSFGAGDSFHYLPRFYKYCIAPLLMRSLYADHNLQEEKIRHSQLEWTIVRPGSLTNGKKTGSYKHGFTVDDKTVKAKISRADVAHFMLKQLNTTIYVGASPSVSY